MHELRFFDVLLIAFIATSYIEMIRRLIIFLKEGNKGGAKFQLLMIFLSTLVVIGIYYTRI
jgi:uncharacterized membrane protein